LSVLTAYYNISLISPCYQLCVKIKGEDL